MKIIGELLELPQLVYHSYFHQVPKKYDNCERQMNLLTLILSLLKRAMASSSRNALVGTQHTQPYFKVRIKATTWLSLLTYYSLVVWIFHYCFRKCACSVGSESGLKRGRILFFLPNARFFFKKLSLTINFSHNVMTAINLTQDTNLTPSFYRNEAAHKCSWRMDPEKKRGNWQNLPLVALHSSDTVNCFCV